MTTLSEAYVAYLAISLFITVYLARTLHLHGRPFLVDVCRGNEGTADAVNHLLVVGFYLTNAAFVLLTLRSGLIVQSLRDAVELLSTKVGTVLFILGIMHFGNLIVLSVIRRWAQERLKRNTPAGI